MHNADFFRRDKRPDIFHRYRHTVSGIYSIEVCSLIPCSTGLGLRKASAAVADLVPAADQGLLKLKSIPQTLVYYRSLNNCQHQFGGSLL